MINPNLVMFRYDPENYDGFFPSQFQIVTLEIKYTWSDNLGCDALASGYNEDISLQGVDYVGWDDPKLSDEEQCSRLAPFAWMPPRRITRQEQRHRKSLRTTHGWSSSLLPGLSLPITTQTQPPQAPPPNERVARMCLPPWIQTSDSQAHRKNPT